MYAAHVGKPSLSWLLAAALAGGCGSSPTAPTTSAISNVVIAAISPAPGGGVVVPSNITYNELGGVILLPESGLISVRLTISSGREVPYGQLNVYLLTDNASGAYCGQNLPDSPTWRSLPAGWTTTVTVTGFQVYRLPCAVTGVRVMFHSRNSGTLTPPTAAETIAEATVPVGFQISQPSRP